MESSTLGSQSRSNQWKEKLDSAPAIYKNSEGKKPIQQTQQPVNMVYAGLHTCFSVEFMGRDQNSCSNLHEGTNLAVSEELHSKDDHEAGCNPLSYSLNPNSSCAGRFPCFKSASIHDVSSSRVDIEVFVDITSLHAGTRSGGKLGQGDKGIVVRRADDLESPTVEAGGRRDTLDCVEEGASNFSNQKESLDDRPTQKGAKAGGYGALFSPVCKSVSAGLYIADFVSNLFVAKKYYTLNYTLSREYNDNYVDWVFPAVMIIIVIAHVANAVAFKLKLAPEEQPLMAAYFLPLIQFRRFVCGLWATGTWQCLNSPEATETDALYGILSAALETGPQLLLQVLVVVLVGNFYTYKYTPSCTQSEHVWCTSRAGHIISVKAWRPSAILLISLVASFLSGAYNGGRAVMLISIKMQGVSSYAIGLFGGLYTFAALLLRATTLATITLVGNRTTLVHVDSYDDSGPVRAAFLIYLCVDLLVPAVIFWFLLEPTISDSLKERKLVCCGLRIIHSFVFGYVSLTLGPLYPIVSHARAHELKQRKALILRLLVMAVLHLLPDVISLAVIVTRSTVNPCGNTTDGFIYDGEAPPLSSILQCNRFRVLVIAGVMFSGFSIIVYCCLILVSRGRTSQTEDEKVCSTQSSGA